MVNFAPIMKKIKTLLVLGMMLVGAIASAQKPMDINLWQQGAPNSNGDSTDHANIRVFLPDAKKASGCAVAICTGMCSPSLAIAHPGYKTSPVLSKMRMAAIVLKY